MKFLKMRIHFIYCFIYLFLPSNKLDQPISDSGDARNALIEFEDTRLLNKDKVNFIYTILVVNVGEIIYS